MEEDGDNVVINYINHPLQGGATNYIYIHNDPKSRGVEFNTREYWNSRLKRWCGPRRGARSLKSVR